MELHRKERLPACIGGSIIIMTMIFLGSINALFASSSSQMSGMMGKNMGMQNMMTMMGSNMGMQNMSTMMGEHMGMMGQHMGGCPCMVNMQKMMQNMEKNMTSMQKMMTLMGKQIAGTHQAAGQSNTVSIVKGASNPSSSEPYNPSPLSVPVGTTITWINNDNTAHTVTEGNPSGNTPPKGFDSGILAPGEKFSHTFDTAGTIQYYCTLHPTMMGEVIVK